MTKLYLTFAFLLGLISCFGQAHQLDKDTAKFKTNPIFILKLAGRDSIQTSGIAGLLPIDIDSITVYRSPAMVKLYGERAENGVVKIQLKKSVDLLDFAHLLTNFNIREATDALPVFIDSAITYRPKNTYFEPAAIKYVKIEQEKATGLKYVSIRTIFQINHQNSGGLVLKGKVNIIEAD